MCLIYGEVDKPLIFRFLYGLFVVLYKSSSIFILGNRFSPILLLFYKRFHVFRTMAIYNYLVLQGKSYFGFLLLVSSVIRLEYQTRQASCVKKVSSKKMHWTFNARGFNLEIILDSGKDLLLKT